MRYPNFIKKNDYVGITALSSGASDSINEMNLSIKNLNKLFNIITTNDVYGNYIVSASKEIRVKELNELLDKNISMIMIARGGDYLIETIPLIDYEKIVNKNIWVMGYSDPTSLLYILTVKYDLATIYGFNGKNFDSEKLDLCQQNSLEIIQGNLIKQESFMDRNTISLNGNFESKGILLGGCLDVLKDIFDTEFDDTNNFINRYNDYQIIWYFDIFSLTSKETKELLEKFKNKGYFRNTDTYLFGTVLFKNEEEYTYNEAITSVIDGNIIFDANIGHVRPCFTLINGMLGKVKYEDNKMTLEMEKI